MGWANGHHEALDLYRIEQVRDVPAHSPVSIEGVSRHAVHAMSSLDEQIDRRSADEPTRTGYQDAVWRHHFKIKPCPVGSASTWRFRLAANRSKLSFCDRWPSKP